MSGTPEQEPKVVQRRAYCQRCGKWGIVEAYWYPPVKTEYIDLCEDDYVTHVGLYGASAE